MLAFIRNRNSKKFFQKKTERDGAASAEQGARKRTREGDAAPKPAPKTGAKTKAAPKKRGKA